MGKNRKTAKAVFGKKAKEPAKFSVFFAENDRQAYPGVGIVEREAQRLSDGLLEPSYIKEVVPAEE